MIRNKGLNRLWIRKRKEENWFPEPLLQPLFSNRERKEKEEGESSSPEAITYSDHPQPLRYPIPIPIDPENKQERGEERVLTESSSMSPGTRRGSRFGSPEAEVRQFYPRTTEGA